MSFKECIMESCFKCAHTGQLVAKHKENQYIYVFNCDNCNISKIRGLSQNIPKWSEFNKSFYDLEIPEKAPIKEHKAPLPLKPVMPIPKIDHSLKAANDHTLDEDLPF